MSSAWVASSEPTSGGWAPGAADFTTLAQLGEQACIGEKGLGGLQLFWSPSLEGAWRGRLRVGPDPHEALFSLGGGGATIRAAARKVWLQTQAYENRAQDEERASK
eukprot:CAMPEP_0195081182 /NCGR_PEP_ID=MMETSP0448-20130528/22712_1 /TAXON_ID=66468 /ORGANISM="Heterocapsa triquestra, Strain CCMP 448" /LENGTH=105 /DNA_ID=CAMNT_0040114193 /DNA_START=12 /DNA_END=328 /DNA_ORIENTATION=-